MDIQNGVGTNSPGTNNMGSGGNPGQTSSGETLNSTGSHTVPYDRFAEVNARARDAEARLAQLEADRQAPSASESGSSATDARTEAEKAYYKQLLEVPDEKTILGKVEQRIQEAEQRRINEENARRLGMQIETLRQQYDGSDGILPPFDEREVIEHATRSGILNPEAAYRDLHFDKFAEKRARENMSNPTYVDTPTSPTAATTPMGAQGREWKDLSVEEMESELKRQGLWKAN